jgi:beta-lactamase regulating signal transducer with metallopeptidase domain
MTGDMFDKLKNELEILNVKISLTNTLHQQILWTLAVCVFLIQMVLVVVLYKMYKKRGRKYKKEHTPSCDVQQDNKHVSSCDGQQDNKHVSSCDGQQDKEQRPDDCV